MKTQLFLLTILMLGGKCFGQNTFQTTIQSGSSEACYIDALYQLSDQSYFVAETWVETGNCANGGTYAHSYTVHLNKSGGIIPGIFDDISFKFNKNEIVTTDGYNILIQIDSTQDTVVNKQLTKTSAYLFNFQKSTIDNFLVAIMKSELP